MINAGGDYYSITWILLYIGAIVAYGRISERVSRARLETLKDIMKDCFPSTEADEASQEMLASTLGVLLTLSKPIKKLITKCTILASAIFILQVLLLTIYYHSIELVPIDIMMSSVVWVLVFWVAYITHGMYTSERKLTRTLKRFERQFKGVLIEARTQSKALKDTLILGNDDDNDDGI